MSEKWTYVSKASRIHTDHLTVERRLAEAQRIVGLFKMLSKGMLYCDNQDDEDQSGYWQLERLAEEAFEHLKRAIAAIPPETLRFSAPHEDQR